MNTTVKFSVDVQTDHNEKVCMTGNDDNLGNWNPDKLVVLQKHVANGSGNKFVWSVDVELPSNQEISYRFCITGILESITGEQQAIIKQWETNIKPRNVYVKDGTQLLVLPVEIFGDYDGYNNVNKSWLTRQSAIQLRFEENPIHMYKSRHRKQMYSIKYVPKDYRIKNSKSGISEDEPMDDDDSNEGPKTCQFSNVLVSILREGVCIPCKQTQFGSIYQQDDIMTVTTETLYPEYLGFHFELYVHDDSKGSNVPRYVGYSHLLPLKNKHTLGEKHMPIVGLKHIPIGEITVKYMIAKPLKGVSFNMESTFQSHWKHDRVLDVGHRGMGSSYKKLATVRENTIASLSAAAQNGADLVEFDIMLTKDLETVIYHDFAVCVQSKKKRNQGGPPSELLTMPVKDLTLQQLQSIKLSHLSSRVGEHIELNGGTDPSDVQPFPTLHQCFVGVDDTLGFNIEIKYPLQDVEGAWEMTGFMDHNTYIDLLLKAVFEDAGSRRIIFSSFDPESCILLQKKQNKYPVLFLSNGPTQRYTPYMDIRAQGNEIAMYFAKSEGLLGVDLQSEGVLRDLSIINKVKDHGLVLFLWGEDNNDTQTINLLRRHGVQGIIYDRIDFYKPEKEKYFEMEKTILEEMQKESLHAIND